MAEGDADGAPTAGPDNFNTLALVEAAYRSAASGDSARPERWR